MISEQLGRESSGGKFFCFATCVDRDDRSGVALDRSRLNRRAFTKLIHWQRKSINKHGASTSSHKAFAKSLALNLCGPESWANY